MAEKEKPQTMNQRDSIIREIIETERTYVKALKILDAIYITSLRAAADSLHLEATEVTKLFSNLSVIVKVNTELLDQLERHWDPQWPIQNAVRISEQNNSSPPTSSSIDFASDFGSRPGSDETFDTATQSSNTGVPSNGSIDLSDGLPRAQSFTQNDLTGFGSFMSSLGSFRVGASAPSAAATATPVPAPSALDLVSLVQQRNRQRKNTTVPTVPTSLTSPRSPQTSSGILTSPRLSQDPFDESATLSNSTSPRSAQNALQENNITPPIAEDVEVVWEPIETVAAIVRDPRRANIKNMNIDLSSLQENLPPGEKKSIGKIFLELGPWLRTYTQYVSNFELSQQYLSKLKKTNQKFSEYLRKLESEALRSRLLSLSQYMVMPVQRIPRYALLVRELVDKTPDDHEEKCELVSALESMKGVAEYVNEKMKEFDNRHKIITIQNQIWGIPQSLTLVQPHRKFVISADVVVVEKSGGEFWRCFLFNDMALFAENISSEKEREKLGTDGNFKFRASFAIDFRVDVKEIPEKHQQNAFHIVGTELGDLTMTTKSPSDRDHLFTAMCQCVEDIRRKSNVTGPLLTVQPPDEGEEPSAVSQDSANPPVPPSRISKKRSFPLLVPSGAAPPAPPPPPPPPLPPLPRSNPSSTSSERARTRKTVATERALVPTEHVPNSTVQRNTVAIGAGFETYEEELRARLQHRREAIDASAISAATPAATPAATTVATNKKPAPPPVPPKRRQTTIAPPPTSTQQPVVGETKKLEFPH